MSKWCQQEIKVTFASTILILLMLLVALFFVLLNLLKTQAKNEIETKVFYYSNQIDEVQLHQNFLMFLNDLGNQKHVKKILYKYDDKNK